VKCIQIKLKNEENEITITIAYEEPEKEEYWIFYQKIL
jgi:hypothetical protein